MKPSTGVIGYKPDTDPAPLVMLAKWILEPPAVLHLVSAVRIGTDDDERKRVAQVRDFLAPVAAELEATGFEVHTHVNVSAISPGMDVVQVADQQDADVIVIGLTKRSRVGKALMGSEAQRVLLSAACPVLCANQGWYETQG